MKFYFLTDFTYLAELELRIRSDRPRLSVDFTVSFEEEAVRVIFVAKEDRKMIMKTLSQSAFI
jgi:hypothetical protein